VAAALASAAFLIIAATERDTLGFRLRSPQSVRVATLLGALTMLTVCYVVVIVCARLFVGGTIPFDWRILAPLIVLLELMIVVAVAHWWHAVHRPFHAVIAVVAVAWIAASATVTARDGYAAMTDGSDFAATEWRTSPLLAWVRAHGTGHTIYSNWPPAVYFHTGRIARELPDTTETRTLLGDFAQTFRESRGVLVAFTVRSPDVVPPDSIATQLGFRQVVRFDDGAIWVAP
jgi:hypothetical protein